MYRVVQRSTPTYLTELCQPCSDIRLRSTSRGDFIVPRSNRQLSNSSFSVAAPSAWNRLPSHIRISSTYTLFLTRLKTRLFAESLLWHCDAAVLSLYFWRPRALDVGRLSKFMMIDWLIDWCWFTRPITTHVHRFCCAICGVVKLTAHRPRNYTNFKNLHGVSDYESLANK